MGRICYSTILNLCRVLTQGQYVGGRQVVCRSQLSSAVLPFPGSFHVRPWDPEAIFSHFLPTRLLVAVISYSFRSHRPTEKKKPTAFCSFKFLENTFLFLPRKQICLQAACFGFHSTKRPRSFHSVPMPWGSSTLPLGAAAGSFPVTGSCGSPRHTLGHFCTWGSRVTSS